VRHQLVDKIQTQGSAKNTRYRGDNAHPSAIFKGRQYKPQNCGGKHYPCGERKNYVRKPMRYFFQSKSEQRAYYRSAAHAQSG
jgi:hypothetical protein